LLTDELVMMLSHPQFGVDLLSVGPFLLLLLIGLLLDGEELHPWLGGRGPHRDRRDGMECRNALQCQHSGDEDRWGYHIVPSRAGGSRAPPALEVVPPSSEESLRVVCRDGDPLCTIPTKMAVESHS
jgi:hypothetical protein